MSTAVLRCTLLLAAAVHSTTCTPPPACAPQAHPPPFAPTCCRRDVLSLPRDLAWLAPHLQQLDGPAAPRASLAALLGPSLALGRLSRRQVMAMAEQVGRSGGRGHGWCCCCAAAELASASVGLDAAQRRCTSLRVGCTVLPPAVRGMAFRSSASLTRASAAHQPADAAAVPATCSVSASATAAGCPPPA